MKNSIFVLITIFCFGICNIYAQQEDSLSFVSIGSGIRNYNANQYYPLLGFRVNFPDSLEPGYSLRNYSLNIGLAKKISRETFTGLENNMKEAIEDEKAFQKLEPYRPYRSCGAFYENDAKSNTLVVDVTPGEIFSIVDYSVYIKEKNVKVHSFRKKKTEYTLIDRSGEGKTSFLFWHSGNVTFCVFTLNGTLTESGLVHFAEQVVKVNKLK